MKIRTRKAEGGDWESEYMLNDENEWRKPTNGLSNRTEENIFNTYAEAKAAAVDAANDILELKSRGNDIRGWKEERLDWWNNKP